MMTASFMLRVAVVLPVVLIILLASLIVFAFGWLVMQVAEKLAKTADWLVAQFFNVEETEKMKNMHRIKL